MKEQCHHSASLPPLPIVCQRSVCTGARIIATQASICRERTSRYRTFYSVRGVDCHFPSPCLVGVALVCRLVLLLHMLTEHTL